MSVLSRELDSYNRALAAYNRDVKRHNRQGEQYNASLVRDANGNLLVVSGRDGNWGAPQAVDADGKVIKASLVEGFNADQYGKTSVDNGFSLLRQNPLSTTREEKRGVYSDVTEEGQTYYWGYGEPDAEGSRARVNYEGDWKIANTNPSQYVGEDGFTPPTYDIYRDVGTYMQKPEEWSRTFDLKAPDPSFSQIRKSGMPSLAQLEGGLIGEVLKGRGAR